MSQILQPRKTRYKKAQKGNLQKKLTYRKGSSLFRGGVIHLIACERRRLSSRQIEAARIALNRKLKNKFLIQVFPNVPITKKPNEVRMGQGKGSVIRWIFRIRPNRIIFSIPFNNIDINPILFQRLHSASHKLPFITKIIY